MNFSNSAFKRVAGTNLPVYDIEKTNTKEHQPLSNRSTALMLR